MLKTRNRTLWAPTLVISVISAMVACFQPPGALAIPVTPVDLADRVEKVLPGVVNISSTTVVNYSVQGWDDFLQYWGVPQERKQTSLGSGFVIDKNGLIITNNHVVAQADEVIVTLQDKREFRARILGRDAKMDLALIKIQDKDRKSPQNINPVPLGDSNSVRIADFVFAVGNPFGLQHTVTAGIISAKNRTIGLGPFDNFLQTDASINPGNSGGPLFNSKGEVIGINTVIFSKTGQWGGVGFAIPVNEARTILADLEKYGRVPRPWLGILGDRINPGVQAYYQLPVSKGVLIFNLVAGGPADESGLKQGDIIVEADGNATQEMTDLERALFKHKPKENLELKVRRGARTLNLKVRLADLPPKIEARLPQGII